jgi:hypothetical protein
MGAGAGLLVVGTAISIFGQMQANLAQAQAERENAAWLEEQAAFIQESTERSLSIYQRDSEFFKESQLEALGSSGFKLTGTASDIYDDTLMSISEEFEAIKRQGYMQQKEALLKANQASRQGQRLGSFEYNALQAAGTGLTAAGQYKSRKG